MNKKKLILLIDDEDALRENIAEFLQFVGYEIVEAENGQQGLKRIREHQPDLIICDVRMPRMTGIELYHVLQSDEGLQQIPFIFYTADIEQLPQISPIPTGVIGKQVTLEALLKIITEVLET